MSRRGFGLVGVILLVLILTGVGLTISYLARHADRSGRWFQHSQMAHSLADAGIKQALYLLSEKNSEAEVAGSDPFSQVFERLAKGATGGAITLFSSKRTSDLPAAIATQIDPLAAEFSPSLDVTLEVIDGTPFWQGLNEGIPLQEGEKQGGIRITSLASVKTPVGVRVERTLTLEKGYKVVSLLPPLLGRFSLFVDPRTVHDPNVFSARFDPSTGDAVAEAGNAPVILRSPVVGAVVAKGSNQIDRGSFVNSLADPKFLDKQGWVYLGPGDTAGGVWTLKLTHGYGFSGETILMPGERFRVPYKGGADEQGFRKRFDDEFEKNAMEGCGTSLEKEMPVGKEGLEHFTHGWATNYEMIGLDPPSYPAVAGRAKMNFGNGTSSALRLFGTPDACSPTVVFGPAYASTIRRASILALVGPPEFCPTPGYFRFHLYKIADHVAKFQSVINAAFGGDYDAWGTNIEPESPIADRLNILLSTVGNGSYAPDGQLDRTPDGTAKSFQSDYFPWVTQLGTREGIPVGDLQQLVNGQMKIPTVFDGNLAAGLKAFVSALNRKTTYEVAPDAFAKRLILPGNQLEVPGIVRLRGAGGVTLPAGLTIRKGGIVVVPGTIEITGDIRRSAATEPLTLVSLNGDIVVRNAKSVDAFLVSVTGKLDVQAPGLIVSGGVACRELDIGALRALAEPMVVLYAPESDPVGPNRAGSLRTFYGGEDRVVASGSGP